MVNQAAILVGGLGTRLGSLTQGTPKPMLPISGCPFLEFLLDELSRHGISEILLLAGYRAENIFSKYHGKKWRGAQVQVIVEESPLGTGGALRSAKNRLHEQFLLLNGDSLFDINLCDFLCEAAISSALAHIALSTNSVGDRYGRVKLHKDGIVAEFYSSGGDGVGPINAGIYCLRRELLEQIPEKKVSFEESVLHPLAKAGGVTASQYDGYFLDIGVPEDFNKAQREIPDQTTRPAVFLDRDGVINLDTGYVYQSDECSWIPGAKDAIKMLNDRGYFVFVVTNQAGVGRGYYSIEDVVKLHDWMGGELRAMGAHVDEFAFCPHHPDAGIGDFKADCRRRKPNPGMIEDLKQAWSIDWTGSFLIGDKDSDIQAAKNAGLKGHKFDGVNLLEYITCLEGGGLGDSIT